MKNKLSLLAFTALASSIGALTPVLAQTGTASPGNSDPGTISLDQITVTATRGDKQALDVPGTVTVISRQELDERIVRDTQDLVRYEPGVTVNRQTGGTDPFANYGGVQNRALG